MNPIEFLVQGSAEDPYRVVFKKVGDNLSAYCSCPAGKNGQFCKHRGRIMAASQEGIVSPNGSDVSIVTSWIEGTDVAVSLAEVMRLETELEKNKRDLTKAKKILTKALYD